MLFNVILLLASAIAVYLVIRNKNFLSVVITSGMISGILLIVFLSGIIGLSGYYIYLVFVALAFVYGLIYRKLNIVSRIIVCLMTAVIFAYWLWVLNHWHGNVVFFPMITIIAALAGILFRKKLKNEAGFLVLLSADAIAIISELFMKA